MKKALFILLLALLFTGCNTSYSQCKEAGYKGIVLNSEYTNTEVYCSNGNTTPNGLAHMAHDGTKIISNGYIYIPFK